MIFEKRRVYKFGKGGDTPGGDGDSLYEDVKKFQKESSKWRTMADAQKYLKKERARLVKNKKIELQELQVGMGFSNEKTKNLRDFLHKTDKAQEKAQERQKLIEASKTADLKSLRYDRANWPHWKMAATFLKPIGRLDKDRLTTYEDLRFKVQFHTLEQNKYIGLGDILPPKAQMVKISYANGKSVTGIRSFIPGRGVCYVDINNREKYCSIFDGSKNPDRATEIQIISTLKPNSKLAKKQAKIDDEQYRKLLNSNEPVSNEALKKRYRIDNRRTVTNKPTQKEKPYLFKNKGEVARNMKAAKIAYWQHNFDEIRRDTSADEFKKMNDKNLDLIGMNQELRQYLANKGVNVMYGPQFVFNPMKLPDQYQIAYKGVRFQFNIPANLRGNTAKMKAYFDKQIPFFDKFVAKYALIVSRFKLLKPNSDKLKLKHEARVIFPGRSNAHRLNGSFDFTTFFTYKRGKSWVMRQVYTSFGEYDDSKSIDRKIRGIKTGIIKNIKNEKKLLAVVGVGPKVQRSLRSQGITDVEMGYSRNKNFSSFDAELDGHPISFQVPVAIKNSPEKVIKYLKENVYAKTDELKKSAAKIKTFSKELYTEIRGREGTIGTTIKIEDGKKPYLLMKISYKGYVGFSDMPNFMRFRFTVPVNKARAKKQLDKALKEVKESKLYRRIDQLSAFDKKMLAKSKRVEMLVKMRNFKEASGLLRQMVDEFKDRYPKIKLPKFSLFDLFNKEDEDLLKKYDGNVAFLHLFSMISSVGKGMVGISGHKETWDDLKYIEKQLVPRLGFAKMLFGTMFDDYYRASKQYEKSFSLQKDYWKLLRKMRTSRSPKVRKAYEKMLKRTGGRIGIRDTEKLAKKYLKDGGDKRRIEEHLQEARELNMKIKADYKRLFGRGRT